MTEFSAALLDVRYRRGATLAAVLITGLWHVGNDTAMLAMNWSEYRWPWVSVVMWFVYTGLATGAAIALLRRGTVARPWFLAVSALLISAAVSVASEGALTSFHNWGWGAVGWLGVLASWGRSLAPLTFVLSGNVVVSVVLLVALGHPDRLNLAALLVSAYGAIALQLGFAIGARMLGLAVGWAVDAAIVRGEIEAHRAVAEEVHSARARRFELLQHTAAGALRGLADGTLDPRDLAAQRQCAVEAARLRRLLLETDDVPDPLTHEVSACADIAEQRGIPVDVRTSGPLPHVPVEVRRLLVEPLITVLSTAISRARVTLSAVPGGISVSVLADTSADPPPPSAGPVEIEYQREGESLWVQLSWHSPSPSPSSRTTASSSTASAPGSTAIPAAG
ncbi:hypothetical protein [Lentzea albidocapillata]|uniref:Signal transduction histidine kinase n=1 Tax=Lentzea albidocapillata TaxID=40571 RepID=A0A1W2FRQ1_9PSEU|nr:hypothetical protein [Lentzea albidocapillata]SMD24590.1 hypothetical protein SAMN05660733_07752 [Lentzea albidocapillata]